MIRATTIRIVGIIFAAFVVSVSADCRPWAAEHVKGADFRFFDERPPANEFPMLDADGNPLKLASLRGHVVLLNFWRGNCRYCGMEKRLLRKMQKQLDAPSVKVLCVNLWDRPSWIRHYAEKRPAFMFATRTGKRRAVQQIHVNGSLAGYYIMNDDREAVYEVKGFPTTYVIDPDGRVVASHIGMARWNRESVTMWLAKLAAQGRPVTAQRHESHELPAWLNTLLAGKPHATTVATEPPRKRIGRGPVR